MSRSPVAVVEQIKARNIHVRCLNGATPMEVWADGSSRGMYYTEAAAEQRICELLGLTPKEKVALMATSAKQIDSMTQHPRGADGSP